MTKILFLTNLLPFPGNSGGTQVTRKKIDNFILMGYKIHLFFMNTPVTPQNDLQEFMQLYGDKIDIHFCLNNNNRRSLLNMTKSFLRGIPLNIYRNECKELKREVDAFLKNQSIDFVFCDHLEMFQYVPKSWYRKAIMLEHNAEYMIWRRYSNQLKNPVLRYGILFESFRLQKYEIRACKCVAKVLATPSDESNLAKFDENKSRYARTFLPANDYMLELPAIKNNKNHFNILYIGTLSWQANIQGLEWFINKALPLIKEKYPHVVFDIIGKYKDDFKKSDDSACIYHGFVDNLEPFYANANVFVCPLLFGSGIKIKILDSMYRGLPFVTTSIGSESIDLIDGQNCFIADTPEKFAGDVVRLYEDSILWQKFSDSIRSLAKEKYTWKKENERMRYVIRELIKGECNTK